LRLIIAGNKQLVLQNNGRGTCALAWEEGFLTIGGYMGKSVWHGKVDRCSNHHCPHHHISVRGTTLKENTWIPFPTWRHLDISMPAHPLSPTANRLKYPQLSVFCISNRPYLLLEVLAAAMPGYPAPSCSSPQTIDGKQEEIFPGENICKIIWIYLLYHCNTIHVSSQSNSSNNITMIIFVIIVETIIQLIVFREALIFPQGAGRPQGSSSEPSANSCHRWQRWK